MPLLFPIALLTAGALGAVVLARALRREYRRVNDELDAVRGETAAADEREAHPTLRKDPRSGIYRA